LEQAALRLGFPARPNANSRRWQSIGRRELVESPRRRYDEGLEGARSILN
jgi:hypothetical protein